jgi:hypothetical protein
MHPGGKDRPDRCIGHPDGVSRHGGGQAMRDRQDARIHKVVRRARGAEWRRAEALPGSTVTGKAAEVRVFPPVPLDGWPKDPARLRVSGTDLDVPQAGGPALPTSVSARARRSRA